jgi:hypothetical protein
MREPTLERLPVRFRLGEHESGTLFMICVECPLMLYTDLDTSFCKETKEGHVQGREHPSMPGLPTGTPLTLSGPPAQR